MTSSLERVVYLNQVNYQNYTFMVCKEYLLTFQFGIYFRKNSYLTHNMNKHISEYQTNGLLNNWERTFMDYKYLKQPPAKKDPKKLKLDTLMGGFEILFLGFVSGLFLLLMEIISLKFDFLRDLIENILSSRF